MTEHENGPFTDGSDDELTEETASETDVVATNVSTSTQKVVGETDASDATGVLGRTTDGSSVTYGVVGETQSSSDGAAGVVGEATDTSAKRSHGVLGTNDADGDTSTNSHPTGVFGHATGSSRTFGVQGRADSSGGTGVYGEARSSQSALNLTDQFPVGVYGVTDHDDTETGVNAAAGVVGQTLASSSGETFGIFAFDAANTANSYAIYAEGDSALFGDVEVFNSQSIGGDIHVDGSQSVGTLGTSVYLSSAQTIDTNSSTTVAFDNVVADDFAAWNTSDNHAFTCPADGDYHVSTTVNWGGNFAAGTIHQVDIRVGTTTKAQRWQTTDNDSSSGVHSEHVCKTLRGLSSGDTIDVQVRHTDSASEDISAGEHQTYLTIDKIG